MRKVEVYRGISGSRSFQRIAAALIAVLFASVALPAVAMPVRRASSRQMHTARQVHTGVRPGVHLRVDAPVNKSPLIPHLDYYGGPIISQVQVYAVFWGANVDATVQSNIGGFYSSFTGSAMFDWLTEYDTNITGVNNTPGTNQTLQHGSFAGAITITPANANTSLTDSDIQTEIASQIQANALPAPTANTYYALYFPPGIHIDLDGLGSCTYFCAYHSTMTVGAQDVFYGIMPDEGPGSGCDIGCGADPSMFNNLTSVSSHELIETVTDAEVGLAAQIAAPLAWYDQNLGEIGDICNGMQGSLAGYVVQQEWSNHYGRCMVVPPVPGPPPANDACSSATVIASIPTTTAALDTTGATTAGDPTPSCGSAQDGATVWYEITPTQSGMIGIDTSASDYFTTVSVYTGTCGALTQVACSVGDPAIVNVTAGTTYLIEVSQFNAVGGGSLVLSVDYAHDAVVKSVAPKTITVPNTKLEQNATIAVTVINADTTGSATSISLSVVDFCGIVSAGPDFGPKSPGNSISLAPGKSATAKVTVTVPANAFVSPQSKSPDRCYIEFDAATSSSMDPQPYNNSSVMEVNVIDKHEF